MSLLPPTIHRGGRHAPSEPLAWALVFTWAFVLALWNYLPLIFWYGSMFWDGFALAGASVVLGTRVPLWYASFLPAAAVALAGYALVRSAPQARASPRDRRGAALRSLQRYGMLCMAFALWVLMTRLLPFNALLSNGMERSADTLRVFVGYTEASGWWLPAPVEHQALIGALGLAVVIVQSWGLLAGDERSRRRFLLLTVSLVACGWAAISGRIVDGLSPTKRHLLQLDTSDAGVRGLLLGDAADNAAAAALLKRYFETHDASGRPVPLNYQRWNYPIAPLDEDDPCRSNLCQVCRLPGVSRWTMSGLSLRLGESAEGNAGGAVVVVEVPRGGHEARVYGRPWQATKVVPIDAIAAALDPAERVVLKIDFALRMPAVLALWTQLRDRGIRDVDLAVMSHGFDPLPVSRPHLTLNAWTGRPAFVPDRCVVNSRRLGIAVKQYVPPPGRACPEPSRCFGVEDWEYAEAWSLYCDQPAGSLPEGVTLQTDPTMKYGTFIGHLERALSGGAPTIDVTLDD